MPGLAKPTPGADPTGFMWLTWRAGEVELALEIHPGLLVSRMYLWRHRRDGQAPPAHQRGRKVLYLRSEVEQWMREQRVT
jgi:hypothetical protein